MPPSPTALIDVDDPTTWPDSTKGWVRRRASALVGTTRYVEDLAIHLEEEAGFRQTLGPCKVRAFHCTRLLPHEIADIRTNGLRLLTEDLVRDRITAAIAHEALPTAAQTAAEQGNVYAVQDPLGRENQTCVVVGRSIFDSDAGGLAGFLTYWGGEAIRGGPADVAALAHIGIPSIVDVRIDMTRPLDDPYSHPPLANVFVGAALGLLPAAEIYYPQPIAAEDISDVWHPGDPDYARHRDLPRE